MGRFSSYFYMCVCVCVSRSALVLLFVCSFFKIWTRLFECIGAFIWLGLSMCVCVCVCVCVCGISPGLCSLAAKATKCPATLYGEHWHTGWTITDTRHTQNNRASVTALPPCC